jgi:phosphopantothenoylcysteine decarboxylase/phosphopantothenate--cysteine ligase
VTERTQDGPRILLGVTGGIAAYKSPELVRRLTERGAQVQVVMTRGARAFVSPLTFQAVSSRRVRDDIWDAEAEAAMGHIELARWADLVLVAPATAHCIGSLANGLAGDLLSTVCLATSAPLMVAPAMNHLMWQHPAVQANVRLLEQRGTRILGPGTGDQACGEQGPGRMLEPAEIVEIVFEAPARLASQSLKGIRVLITAGPTREPIDPVRYVTNRSSGKMGYAIAAAARQAGADVVLVSGPVALPVPAAGIERIDVETAEQMYAAVQARAHETDLFIGCAAVSDYRPESPSLQKIKRQAASMNLALVRSPDTLASVAAIAGGPFTVGFAAETQDVERHARDKLVRKGVDMMAANLVGPSCGFDQETNALTVLWKEGGLELEQAPKAMLAQRLIAVIAERYHASRGSRGAAPQASPAS